ncbi:amino acid adenylation domain-containing protein [Caulobacter sp. S45]|uniref:non-ribosomal peptide synthetase n=1 Tax=Caulobacter sp. S45 TaxID=1641861 RepID=UPI00131E0388|nr:amino acid adenylation domain-containing protein [Caulobacter sp. S45]
MSLAFKDATTVGSMEELNRTACKYPRDLSLATLIAAQAERTPDALAVQDGRTRLTYAELERRSARIANRLAELGAGPGGFVGVCLERSVDTVAALLAVLKTGAAYIPLDPAYPAQRLALMVEDAGCDLVLTEHSVAGLAPAAARSLALEDIVDGPESFSIRSGPEDLAYVIYTSGSTGRPKGVELRHRSVVNLLNAFRRTLDFTARDRLLAVTTISFDISVLEIFLPLTVGAAVILAGREDVVDGARLAALIQSSAATVLQATPATWRLLIGAGWRGAGMKLLCGGEAVDPALARRLLECGGGRFWNVYGPTETTIWSTFAEVRSVDSERIPIGRPLDNTRLYILDEAGVPVAPGEAGELFIAGDGVARGYLGRPDLNAERFVPEIGSPDERMYRTGDRARLRPDGQVDFLGRVDHQVKVRGFRIEPGEIEARLAEHADVAQAVVIAQTEPDGGSRLVAFIVPRRETPTQKALKAFLGETLPAHMVPNQIVLVASLPLTPNGKVDRNTLAANVPEAVGDGENTPPRDDLETALVRIFEEVLFVRPVGVHDDFFQLGGTSFRAVKVVNAIERRLGRKIHVNALYHRAATVAGMAGILRGDAESAMPHLQPLGGRIDTGAANPIFCLHTVVEGTVFFYDALARRLGGQECFLGVLPRGLHDGGEADNTMEGMAEHCVAAIQSRQPQGPYRLLGFSSAGVLAMETARRLKALGQEVSLLGMIDAYPPVGKRTWLYQWEIQSDRVCRLGNALITRVHALSNCEKKDDPADAALRWRHRLAVRAYRAQAYDGDAALFVSKQTVGMFAEPGLGWSRLTAKLDYDVLAGGHYSIVNEPGVAELADRLCARLDAGRAA